MPGLRTTEKILSFGFTLLIKIRIDMKNVTQVTKRGATYMTLNLMPSELSNVFLLFLLILYVG